MDRIATGIFVGVLGTIAMDLLNHLYARFGVIIKIDIGTLGRMSAGWARGRFRYHHPEELTSVANETLWGYITHYGIGVGLAMLFVFGWDILVGGPLSPFWAFAYGIATVVAIP